jgi:hypothetical protein
MNTMIKPQSRLFRWMFGPALVALLATIPSAWAIPPANDDIASAVTIPEPLPFTDSISTVEATTAADDPDCVGQGPTVWYVYTPSADGYVGANTAGSDYDTTLSVYTGTPGSLVQIACNDDDPFNWPLSKLYFQGFAGTTYYFMLGAFASRPGGNLTLNVESVPAPAIVEVVVTEPVAVEPSTGTALVQVRLTASSPVLVDYASAFLQQPTGRGNIVGQSFFPVFAETDSVDATLLLKDAYSLKLKGSGFVGGKARLILQLFYQDPTSGFQVFQFDQEVQLKGTRK